MTNNDALVFGESARDIATTLRPIFAKRRRTKDGMVRVSGIVEPSFMHAMLRAEAEELLKDADRWGTPGFEDRTDGQRRYDAMMAIIERIAALNGATRTESPGG